MNYGIVSRTEGGLFRYQGWPTVCRDEKGVLYVVCSGHRLSHVCPFGKNLMYVSRDEGKTWSLPTIINDTELDDRDGGMVSLGHGKLLMTYFNNPRDMFYDEGLWKYHCTDPIIRDMAKGLAEGFKHLPDERYNPGSFIRLSNDSGKTWMPAIKVPVSSPHGPIKLKDGRLLYVGNECQSGIYEKGKIFAFESTDGGQSWNCLSKIEKPADFFGNLCEPHAVELEGGRIVVALRYQRSNDIIDISTCICHSDDGGKSWSEPKPLGICGAPPHFLLHSSGALVLTYGRRLAPFGQRAMISYDGGNTFGDEIEISERAEDNDLGYPSSVELDDGSMLTVYYQKLKGDGFCSILYTKWSLPEKR